MGPPKREPAGGAPTEYVDPSGQHPVAMQHQTAMPEPPAVIDHQHLHQQQAPPPPLSAHNVADHGNYNNYQQQQQQAPPPHNMGDQVNYNNYQQQAPPPQKMGDQVNYNNYQQQQQAPPPPHNMGGQVNYNYQQQASQPPAVVQFPPPSPNNNMPHQHQQPAAFPPANNNMNNNAAAHAFPPQNGYNAHQQQQQYANGNGNGNGYNNVNMNNNGMPPASPQKAVYHHAPSPVNGVPMAAAGTPVSAWKSGLFDCMDDPMNAIITAFFPCLTFGQVAEIVDGGHTSCGTSGMLYGLVGFFLGVPFIMSCTYRTKLRNMFGLVESPAPDWVTHFLCEWCALCQEYRELQLRGYDPSIGWLGNQALRQHQQQQQVMMAPPMNQRMMG